MKLLSLHLLSRPFQTGRENRQSHRQSAFSLIELMVVISIISLIASLSVEPSRKFKIRAIQTGAKMNLNAEKANLDGHISEVGSLVGAKSVIRISYYNIGGGSSGTEYVYLAHESGTCTNRAISNYCPIGDMWMLTNDGVFPVADSSKCTGGRDFSKATTFVKTAIANGIMMGIQMVSGQGHNIGTGCP